MKFFIYHIISSTGEKVDYMTGDKSASKLMAGHDIRVDWLEKQGWKVERAVSTPQRPLEATTAPQTLSFCEIHQVEMKERQGKYGKFYSHAQQVGEEWVYCTGKGWGKK